jgi:hypothetical protein
MAVRRLGLGRLPRFWGNSQGAFQDIQKDKGGPVAPGVSRWQPVSAGGSRWQPGGTLKPVFFRRRPWTLEFTWCAVLAACGHHGGLRGAQGPRSCPGVVPELSRSCPGVVPELSRSCPGAVPELSRGLLSSASSGTQRHQVPPSVFGVFECFQACQGVSSGFSCVSMARDALAAQAATSSFDSCASWIPKPPSRHG